MNIVKFPIVETEHTRFFKWGVVLYIAGVIMMVVLLVITIKSQILRVILAVITMAFVTIVPIIIGIRKTIIKEYKVIGELIVSKDVITISLHEKKDEYRISALKNISLYHNNVADMPIGRGPAVTEGIYNFFKFDFNETHYQYQILIKNYTWLRIFENFVHTYQISIELYKRGKKVDTLMK